MTEAQLHQQVCGYLRLQYPRVIFNSDGAGNNQPSKAARGMATTLRSSRGYPDLFIAEPRNGYHGLFIELKREGVRECYGEGCSLVSHEHIHEQAAVLRALTGKGYLACFAVGFDEAKAIIDTYLSSKPTNLDLNRRNSHAALEV